MEPCRPAEGWDPGIKDFFKTMIGPIFMVILPILPNGGGLFVLATDLFS